jgi:hypothetical protein
MPPKTALLAGRAPRYREKRRPRPKESIFFSHLKMFFVHLAAFQQKGIKRLKALILLSIQHFQCFPDFTKTEFESHRPDHFKSRVSED